MDRSGGKRTSSMGVKKRHHPNRPIKRWIRVRCTHWMWLMLALINCSDPASDQACRTEDDCRPGEVCRFDRCLTPQRCERNIDCISTEICHQSICSPYQCDANSICGQDRTCILGWCQSIPAGECQTDNDCPLGPCDQRRGLCLLTPPCDSTLCGDMGAVPDASCDGTDCIIACGPSDDCPMSMVCDVQAGYCIHRDCDAHADCQINEYCDDGRCRDGCRLDTPNCQPGVCDPDSRECRSIDCSRHTDCDDGYCELSVQEQPKRQCRMGERPQDYQPCNEDQACSSGACLESGFCFWPCLADSDCPSGLCALDDWTVEQVTYTVRSCIGQDGLCQNDIECPVGRSCLPNIAQQMTRLTCQQTPPGRSPGSLCQDDADCQSQVCLETTCWGPCVPDANGHCGLGQVCYENVHYRVSQANDAIGPYVGFSGCLPNFGSDSECESRPCVDDEVCVLRPDSQRAGWTARCRRAVGDRGPGANCEQDIECRSRWCSDQGFCVEPCDLMNLDENCLEGTVCQSVLLPLWKTENDNALEDATSICAPGP